VFSSDRSGIPDLYVWGPDSDELRRITRVLSGAFQPDVSPDGQWIVFTLYGSEGFRLARIPYDPAAWWAPDDAATAVVADVATAGPGSDASEPTAPIGGPARGYSAAATLPPTGWFPQLDLGTALGIGVGAVVDGRDVVARHIWRADAMYYPSGGRLDARANHLYRGWGEVRLELDLAQTWGVLAEGVGLPVDQNVYRADLLRRNRQAALLLRRNWPGWRASRWLGGGVDVRKLTDRWTDGRFDEPFPRPDWPLDLGARLFGGYSSARGYAFSISPEQGELLQFSAEARRLARPLTEESDRSAYARLIGLAQNYRAIDAGGFARHALALRLAAGIEAGAAGPGFGVGGVSGGSVSIVPGVGVDGTLRTFGVRGYAAGARRGDRAVVATAEYRVPIALVERGVRAWPVFLDRVWGDVFVDVGDAWCAHECDVRFGPGPMRAADPLVAVGAELVASTGFGFGPRSLFRGGLAVPLRADASGIRPSPQLYLVGGRSF
jgi:hypothetical protein